MDFSILMSFIQVMSLVLTCTQKNLGIHIRVYMINVSIFVFNYCILIARCLKHLPFWAAIFKSKKKGTTVAYCEISTIKC